MNTGFETLAWSLLAASVPTFVSLHYVVPSQPWGKFLNNQNGEYERFLGPRMAAPLAWFLFESPNLVWCFLMYKNRQSTTLEASCRILLLLFTLHYVNRAILYALALAKGTKTIPFAMILSAFIFTNCNGYLQAGFLCNDARFPERWERHPQFAIGVLVFCLGGYINIQSDATLRKLRQAGGGYQIPYGGMFQHVSSPHYFGEILEWTGFAIASRFSLPSVAFVVYTASNLIPRGLANHTWYLKNFGDKYPRGRHAVIPFLW